jgi:hypothetical protein
MTMSAARLAHLARLAQLVAPQQGWLIIGDRKHRSRWGRRRHSVVQCEWVYNRIRSETGDDCRSNEGRRLCQCLMADSGIGVAGRAFKRDRGVDYSISISIVHQGVERDVEREVNSTVCGCSTGRARDRDGGGDGGGCRGGSASSVYASMGLSSGLLTDNTK